MEYSFDEEQKLILNLTDFLKEVTAETTGIEIVLREVSPLFFLEKNALKSRVAVNREKICEPSSTTCEKILAFGVMKNSELLDIFKVKLIIHDINDHAPKFPIHRLVLNLTEDHDFLILLPVATDLDGPQYNIHNYTLTGSDQFSLTIPTPLHPNDKPQMILNYPLDREEQDFYRLVLTAFDQGQPPKSSSVNIGMKININNIGTVIGFLKIFQTLYFLHFIFTRNNFSRYSR